MFKTFNGEFFLQMNIFCLCLSKPFPCQFSCFTSFSPLLSCWLAALNEDDQFDFGKPMFWGFLLPVGLILIYNVVLLVLVSLTTCRTDPTLNR